MEVIGTGTGHHRVGPARTNGHDEDADDDDDFRRSDDSALLESLDLPPTKLHKRHLRLVRRYASKQDLLQQDGDNGKKREEVKEVRNGDDEEEKPPARPLTSYERNKQNNMKSNIVLPTATSSDDSVDDSR